ncbi:hypothetical protein HaLaN_07796 [Haematococcus lacustris]|uniref:Uncharacterized protein n=1 Tax=Haematococcus lacustris TaxID=44745 RepID=A0A699YQI2_HAELA|nr:hypothetical protein HaLaN_07796 [Haematococcus lacustris]
MLLSHDALLRMVMVLVTKTTTLRWHVLQAMHCALTILWFAVEGAAPTLLTNYNARGARNEGASLFASAANGGNYSRVHLGRKPALSGEVSRAVRNAGLFMRAGKT